MKKITHIVLGLSLLAVFSCEKQNICPNSSRENVKSEWSDTDTERIEILSKGKSNEDSNHLKGLANPNGVVDGSEIDNNGDLLIGADGDITDPNNDPDKGRKKSK